jgi:hypothetical protein
LFAWFITFAHITFRNTLKTIIVLLRSYQHAKLDLLLKARQFSCQTIPYHSLGVQPHLLLDDRIEGIPRSANTSKKENSLGGRSIDAETWTGLGSMKQ